MINPNAELSSVIPELDQCDAPLGADILRGQTEADLMIRIGQGEEVEIPVGSLTADTGIQGIAIGKIYHSAAIHTAPETRSLTDPAEIGREVMRVEDACRMHLGTLDASEARLAVGRARGVLGRAANWDSFAGEFLFHIYAARDVFQGAEFMPVIEQYRGGVRPEPSDLAERIEQRRKADPDNSPDAPSKVEQFRKECINEYQLSLLNSLKEKILPELARMDEVLEEQVRTGSQDRQSSLADMPADKVFLCFARDVAKKVREGFDAESTAFTLNERKIEMLRQENEEIQARLEKRHQELREAAAQQLPFERDLRGEYADRSTLKENHNRIAEFVGLRTTLLKCLRGEFVDLRLATEQPSEQVIIVGDLAVPCVLQAIPPSTRAGMVVSENSGIGHTELAFTSTMKPIAGASDLVLAVLKSCSKDTLLVYDGSKHMLTINPTAETVARARAARDQLISQIKQPLPEIPQQERMRPVEVMINVRSAQMEVIDALRGMGASVGLYTPESDSSFEALMERTEVSRQQDVFKKLLRLDQEITIRAFDFSGDKFSYRKDDSIRGNDFARDHSWTTRDELIAQFKAVIRAGASRTSPFTLLFPNITGPENLRTYLEAVDRAYDHEKEFPATGIFRAGVQIESITAVRNTLEILRGGERFGRDPEIRLVAIGTNDLGMEVTQHEEGRAGDDRTTARINHYNPELFSHILSVRQQLDQYNAERRANDHTYQDIPLEVCGVMASQRMLIPVLIGLGVNKFSVGIGSAHDIATLISRFDEASCRELVERLIKKTDSDDVKLELINFWDAKIGLTDFEIRKDGEVVPIFDEEILAASRRQD